MDRFLVDWAGGEDRMGGAVRLDGEYLSLPQAAEVLGCSRQALATAVRRGILKAVRINPQRGCSFYLVSVDEVERYRREHLGRRAGLGRGGCNAA